jgi:hypothetical protein
MSNPTMRHESQLDAARQRPCEVSDAASTREHGTTQDFAQGNKLCLHMPLQWDAKLTMKE